MKNIVRSAFLLLLPISIISCTVDAAPRSDFDEVAQAIESATNAERIPLFGLGLMAKSLTSLIQPAGASNLRFAVFDPGFDQIDGQRFQAAVSNELDSSWQMTLRVRSRRGEHTLIYTRPRSTNSDQYEVLFAHAQSDEGVLAQFNVSTSDLIRLIRTKDRFGEFRLNANLD